VPLNRRYPPFAAVLLILAACGGTGTTPATPQAPIASDPTRSSSAADGLALVVGTDTGAELSFDPPAVTVPAGAAIVLTFENRATVPHNLTFSAPITAATSTVVAPGTTESLRLATPGPGTYGFTCTLHPGMAGTLTVE